MGKPRKNGIDRAADFPDVLAAEREQIEARRQHLGLAAPDDAAEADRRLVGLSFSGGGIRSASFNLGVLQGLARLELLRFIDYLSTVSGGGYIGSWLTAWVQRQRGGVRAVEQQLRDNQGEAPQGTEPGPIQHLRRFSNYLAPRTGFLSADSWVLGATYLRNFLLTQFVLLPAVVGVLLVSRLAMLFYHPIYNPSRPWEPPPKECFAGMAGLCAALLLGAFVLIFRAAMRVRARTPAQPTPARASPQGMMRAGGMTGVTVLLSLLALLFCWCTPYPLPIGPQRVPEDLLGTNWQRVGLQLGVFGVAGAVLIGLGHVAALLSRRREERPGWGDGGILVLTTSAAGMMGGALFYGTYTILNGFFDADGVGARDYIQARATARLTTFGPPMVLAALVLAICFGVGLLKRRLGEELREWWASLCGRLLVAGVIWITVNLIALYGTALVLWSGPWVGAALGSGWLLTVAGGVLAGGSQETPAVRKKPTLLDRLARLAPHVFVAGLLIAVSLLIYVMLDNPPNWRAASDAVWSRRIEPERPPTRVTVTTVRKPESPAGESERADTVEREELIDDAAIVGQMYWLGILNTEPDFVPVENYRLSAWDLTRLKKEGVPDAVREKLTGKLSSGAPNSGLPRQEFLDELDRQLPKGTSYTHRLKIIQYAKNVTSMQFDRNERLRKLFLCLLICAGLVALAAWRVDVNLYSLHSLYGNRLVRAYLGASRPQRAPDPVTGLDPDDDLHLASLRAGEKGYDGPYLIVNTALNLVSGSRLDWQERKAAPFVFTPLFCGSEDTGYRATAAGDPEGPDGYAGNVLLGTAVTISGAAASPNMGYHSSPAVTALLTVFNARLGAWLGNPASPTRWQQPGPRFGFLHLFRELFGLTRARGGYVYLSDGGHFENLGVYELVRRRCQYVILCDSGQDGNHAFEDLGNLIRKCRTDFGIRIEVPLDSLQRSSEGGRCRWHCALGKIRYDDVDPQAAPGTLVYLKPSLTGDEPADVLHYAVNQPDFPHETTGDQFFSESQFESYRALGQHIAETVFTQPVTEMEEAEEANRLARAPESAGVRHQRRCRELFSSLVRRWFTMPPEYESTFLESTRGYVSIHEALRNDARLWRLTLDLYPELDPEESFTGPPGSETDEQRAARSGAELSVIAQMFQVMENAWLSLNLEVNYAHPLNRGWMAVFHRWTAASTVRQHWPVLRGEFGRGFVSFCEKQMQMGVRAGLAVAFPQGAVSEVLRREFEEQWPELPGLAARVEKAAVRNGQRLVWLIYPHELDLSAEPLPEQPRTPSGLIVVTAAEETVYELFVWMRGAYRNTGLGRPAVRQVLDAVRRLCPLPFRLRVRLPVANMTGPGGKLQRGMWLTFFHHHEFVRVQPVPAPAAGAGDAEEAAVLLERHFPAEQ